MRPEVFAEWMRLQGHKVLKTGSSYWLEAGVRVYQAFPYHRLITPDPEEVDRIFSEHSAIALRYSSPLDNGRGSLSYHVVCERGEYSQEDLSKKARHDVQRGLSAGIVERIPLGRLAVEGWNLRLETLARQGRLGAETADWWHKLCLSAEVLPGFEAWGAIVHGRLAAALLAFSFDDCFSILYQQSLTRYLPLGVNNALAFVVTADVLSRPEPRRIFYGLHSLDAPSSVDAFKFRMGYCAKPVWQRVQFHPLLNPLVNRSSHAILKLGHRMLPGNSTMAKAEGIFRVHLQSKLPFPNQPIPAALRKQHILVGHPFPSLTAGEPISENKEISATPLSGDSESTSYPILHRSTSSLALKRAFDVAGAVCGLLALSPLFALVAIRIRREDPGPIFHRGIRIGRNDKPFKILKFRTTYERQESCEGQTLTAVDDGRVTPLGRWLRETRLSELPQLWNVLKGEMSLVGPRPAVPEFVQTWPADSRRELLSISPGITGPASVTYRQREKLSGSGNPMDAYLNTALPDKLRLDQLYVRNHSLLSDVDVIFMTLAALLTKLRESNIKPGVLGNDAFSRFVRRYISWFLIDSLVALGAISLSGLLWRVDRPLDLGLYQSVGMSAMMALIFSLVNSVRGLGRISWRHAQPAYAFDLLVSSAITTLGAAALDWFWPQGRFLPGGMVFVAGMMAFFGFLSVRYRERLLTGIVWRWLAGRDGEGSFRERVLVVGAGDCGLLACWLLGHSQCSNVFSIAGLVDDNPSKNGMIIEGYRVIGPTRQIPELVEKDDIGVILFAIEKIYPAKQEHIIELCKQTRARLVMFPDLLRQYRDRVGRGDFTRPKAADDLECKMPLRTGDDLPIGPLPRPSRAPGEI